MLSTVTLSKNGIGSMLDDKLPDASQLWTEIEYSDVQISAKRT